MAERGRLDRQSSTESEVRQARPHKRVVVVGLDVEAGHGGVAHTEGVRVIVVVLRLKCGARRAWGRSCSCLVGRRYEHARMVGSFSHPFPQISAAQARAPHSTHHGPTRPVLRPHHAQMQSSSSISPLTLTLNLCSDESDAVKQRQEA